MKVKPAFTKHKMIMVTVPLSRDGWLNGIDIMADYGRTGISIFISH